MGQPAPPARAGVAVPGRVSVADYDGSPRARPSRVDPTTIGRAAKEQVRDAMNAVVERLDRGRTETRETVPTPQLVGRITMAGVAPVPECAGWTGTARALTSSG
ncbi:substrate-binding domain-containing protein [Streptomyces sp. 1222.5]|uniref:substrate-binding domain-containing protein n=1 Tax=Streptomyces sp. 1222.5 TaxID=1881026 RepID=UPI003D70FFE1